MRRTIIHVTLMTGLALALGACGFTDSRSPVPEFMRAKAADPPPPEPPPDVKQMVRKDLDAVFAAGSHPRQIRVSPALHEPHGAGWLACVRAEFDSATGRPLGTQTYRITISGGMIIDRRRVETDDSCPVERFEPI